MNLVWVSLYQDLTLGYNFKLFDKNKAIIQFVPKVSKIGELTNWVKRPQIGAKGLIYVKCNEDGTFKSSVDKFFDQKCLSKWANNCKAEKGDLLLVLSGNKSSTQKRMNELRLRLGKDLGFYKEGDYQPVWVIDFPLFEKRRIWKISSYASPFTSPGDKTAPEKVRVCL